MRKTAGRLPGDRQGKVDAQGIDRKEAGPAVMAFALPACVATWIVLAWFLPRIDRELKAQGKRALAGEARRSRRSNRFAAPAGRAAFESSRLSSRPDRPETNGPPPQAEVPMIRHTAHPPMRRRGLLSMELVLTLPILGILLLGMFEFSMLFFARGPSSTPAGRGPGRRRCRERRRPTSKSPS